MIVKLTYTALGCWLQQACLPSDLLNRGVCSGARIVEEIWQTCCGRADCAAVVLPRQRHKGRCACLCQPVPLQVGTFLLGAQSSFNPSALQ